MIALAEKEAAIEKYKAQNAKIEDLARQMLVLTDQYDIIIVSSGAIAGAKQTVISAVSESKDAKPFCVAAFDFVGRSSIAVFSLLWVTARLGLPTT